MPWKDRSVVQLRKEFVLKALAQEAPFSTVCRRYGISRKTGYKWLERFRERGLEGLIDESRRPLGSPFQTTSEIALEVIRLRKAHPTWGAKKIREISRRIAAIEQQVNGLSRDVLLAWESGQVAGRWFWNPAAAAAPPR